MSQPDEQRVFVYSPSLDGEYVPVDFKSDFLETPESISEVFVILDDQARQIFIWTGSESPVRKRFISSQIARQMRLEKGMTYRVSTEEQGNETSQFSELLQKFGDSKIASGPLLAVSPPAGAADLPSPKIPRGKKTRKKGGKQKPKKAAIKTEPYTAVPQAAPKPRISTSPTPAASIPVPIAPTPTSTINYFAKDEGSEVSKAKAKLITTATHAMTLSTLLISTAADEGKVEFYILSKKTKTVAIKSQKPALVLYITPKGQSVYELDDLHIPIPAGNSIYFTCPPSTFIGINLE